MEQKKNNKWKYIKKTLLGTECVYSHMIQTLWVPMRLNRSVYVGGGQVLWHMLSLWLIPDSEHLPKSEEEVLSEMSTAERNKNLINILNCVCVPIKCVVFNAPFRFLARNLEQIGMWLKLFCNSKIESAFIWTNVLILFSSYFIWCIHSHQVTPELL